MQATPVPGIVVGIGVVISDGHGRLVEHGGAMVQLDIVAQFTPVPVGMRRNAILIEIMIAEAVIDGIVHPVRPGALLVAAGELLELPSLPRHLHLPAAVIRHIAAEHEAERCRDPRTGAGEARGPAADLNRPGEIADRIQHRHMAQQRRIRLALCGAIRAQAIGRDKAGMHVAGEQEGRIRREACALRDRRKPRQSERQAETTRSDKKMAARGTEGHADAPMKRTENHILNQDDAEVQHRLRGEDGVATKTVTEATDETDLSHA